MLPKSQNMNLQPTKNKEKSKILKPIDQNIHRFPTLPPNKLIPQIMEVEEANQPKFYEMKENISTKHLTLDSSLNNSCSTTASKSIISTSSSISNSNSIQKIKEDNNNKNQLFDYHFRDKIEFINYSGEYLDEIYVNLLKEEKNLKIKPQFGYMIKQADINEEMRAILIDWLIHVHFRFRLKAQTLFHTVKIIDTYLSLHPILRAKLQLLGITALFIACKSQEIYYPQIKDFIEITNKAYTKEELLEFEIHVLQILNFDILSPTCIDFYDIIAKGYNFEGKEYNFGKYFLESTLIDYQITKYSSSVVSVACAYIVMKFFKMENYHESYNKKFYVLDETVERYSEHNIKECAKDICLFVDNIKKTNYQACLKKYSKPEQEKVALLIMNN